MLARGRGGAGTEVETELVSLEACSNWLTGASQTPGNLVSYTLVCIGNRMDESAIWEKIAWQQKNCMRRSRVLFELL